MIIVDHYVGKSSIHGLGIFLKNPVAAGSVIWKFDPMFDIELTQEFIAMLAPEDAEIIYHHAEYIAGRNIFRLGNDADIFMNHSDTPTLIDKGDIMVARHNLKAGEELTCSYSEVRVIGFEAKNFGQRVLA